MDVPSEELDDPPEMDEVSAAGEAGVIPRFYLYGEPHRSVDAQFIHVESLDDRSRPSQWRIRPHAHAELNHLLHLTSGGGTMHAEGRRIALETPCLVMVPAGTAHGFDFAPDSQGSVITIASRYLRDLEQRDPALAGLMRPASTALDVVTSDAVGDQAARLMRETGWAAPGHRAAAEALLLSILVVLLRSQDGAEPAETSAPSRQAALVARLRERIEQRFRLREPVSVHAEALGVSVSALRAACARVAGQAPMEMLDARALLEARRALLYSTLTVAETGYALGFSDPAYFSRFFARHVGTSPERYRKAQG